MRLYSALVLCLSFSILGVLPAEAQVGRDRNNNRVYRDTDEICVYRDNYFQGAERCFNPGDEIPSLATSGNDSGISSIHVYGRARVVLYEDTNFRGASREFTSDTVDLAQVQMSGSRTWNDRSRSLRVMSDDYYYDDGNYGPNRPNYGGRPGWRRGQQRRDERRDDRLNQRNDTVCVYENANYQGRSQCFSAGQDIADLGRQSNWNDRISSVRVHGNARMEVFQDANFRGNRLTIDRDVADLSQLRRGLGASWNDQITSLEVWGRQASNRR
jgi:hypothetical protein